MKLGLTKKRLHLRQKKDYKKQRITSKQCKSWDGPCAAVDELQLILIQNPDWSEKSIKTEMAF